VIVGVVGGGGLGKLLQTQLALFDYGGEVTTIASPLPCPAPGHRTMLQRSMEDGVGEYRVPEVCVLDPYGHIVRPLAEAGRAQRHADWACFHTELWTTRADDRDVGLVTGALGAAWAVLVARRLAESGSQVLVSVSPALPVHPPGPLPHVALIDRALRDEAVSTAHRPAARWSRLAEVAASRLAGHRLPTGASWSTAAPCRGPAGAR